MKRKCLVVGIILLFVGIAISPEVNATINNESKTIETSDYDNNFFLFAIIWGEFEILEKPYPLHNLNVYNSDDNQTMNVFGYVGGVSLIYRTASWVFCPWWLGIVRQHKLFIIAVGNFIRVW